jgi:6-phosphofructokinase 2
MKAHILTITLNPTVDYATSAPRVIPGPKLRCTEPHIDTRGDGFHYVPATYRMMLG